MNHVAVDLATRKSQFCVRSPDGRVLQEAKVETKDLKKLFGYLEKSHIVLETCSEAFAVADFALAAGHEVSVVPATLAPSLGVGQRGVKNDKRDAENLSMASCRMGKLPSVHLPSTLARDRRSMLTQRATLVAARTMFVNSVKGWARSQLLAIPSGKTSTFPQRVRETVASADLPTYVERALKVLDELNRQIAEADTELEELAQKDDTCRRLMSTPGVGPVTAMSFRASIDDVSRFKSAHAVESYLGLTPGENSTGTTRPNRRLGITGAGPTKVRTALIQAAWCAYRTRPTDPMVLWARKLAEKKPAQVAVTALARKMSGILFALWRDQTTYDPAYQPQ